MVRLSMKKTASICLSIFVLASPVVADQLCGYIAWSEHHNTQLLRKADASAYMFRSNHIKIDADGAPNAYHPDDIGLDCTRGNSFKGLECLANAGYPSKSWWKSVLVPDPKNPQKAYIQSSGPFAGYYISKTALTNPAITDPTNPERYVDASKIPYLDFPGKYYKKKGTGRLGDLGYAINLSNGKASPFVVADIGPYSAELGEISIELGERLGGKTPNPRTGAGSPKGEILYILFPYSSKSNPWPLTLGEIEQKAKELLERAGDFESAMACK